MKEKKRLLTAY